MGLSTFKRGVHPPYRKELAHDAAIEVMPAPEVVRIPLLQHIGAPAKPIVERGAQVKMGQPVAEAQGFVSVPAHASVSGKVKAIKQFPHPYGRNLAAVEIENDGQNELHESVKPPENPFALNPRDIVEMVRKAGIVGMGGAAFPTHVKLSPPEGKKIHTIILNGAECEPYLTCDYRMMIERPRPMIEGAKIIKEVVGAERIFIGIENNKPEAIETMRHETASEDNIEVVPLKTKYPQGSELQLIKAVLNLALPKSKLPLEAGVVVQNVGTACAVYELIHEGKPLYERVLTITGEAVKTPKNLLVRIGTPLSEIIKFAGGTNGRLKKLIMGGPMMGLAQYSDQVPVIKGTSGVLLLGEQDFDRNQESPCIRCARCEMHCPAYIAPSRIAQAVRYGNLDIAQKLNIMECIECGSCAYVCPSKIPLVHYFRVGKADIMSMKQKKE